MPKDALEQAFFLIAGDYSDATESSGEENTTPNGVSHAQMTDPPKRVLLMVGEPLVKYQWVTGETYRRSFSGPELDLAVEMPPQDHVEFFSVIPNNVIGNQCVQYMKRNGIFFRGHRSNDGYPMGDMTILKDGTCSYQRSRSAFASAASEIPWDKGIIRDRVPCWVHSSASSVTWSMVARYNWIAFMESAIEPKLQEGDVMVSLELDSVNCGINFEELWPLVMPYVSKLDLVILTPAEIMKLSAVAGISLNVDMSRELHKDIENWTRQMKSLLGVLKCRCICGIFPVDGYKSLAVIHQESGFAWTRPEDVIGLKFISRFMRALVMQGHPKSVDELRSVIEQIGAHSDLVTDNWELRASPSPKAQRS